MYKIKFKSYRKNTDMRHAHNRSPREQVIKQVRDWIRSGEFTRGMMIPGEDEISRTLQVARGTVRSGLELLEEEGVLCKRNRRRYVNDAAARSEGPSLARNTMLLFGVYADSGLAFKGTGFLQAVQAGVIERLSELGKHVININTDKLSFEEIRNTLLLSPTGVVALQGVLQTPAGLRLVEEAKALQLPLVADYVDSRCPDIPHVLPDHCGGNYELTKHFLGRGFRRIHCLYPEKQEDYWIAPRFEGYRRAMKEAGLPPLPGAKVRILPTEFAHTREVFDTGVRIAAGELVPYMTSAEPPEVILGVTDWVIPVIAAACRLFGKEPGRDLHLGGFDNRSDSNPWRDFDDTRPEVTVEKHNTRIGRELADLLLARIDGRRELPLCTFVQPELILNS